MSLESLIEKVVSYHPQADVEKIRKAYRFACGLHADQKRKSGEPYIAHPLEVAKILADLEMGTDSIVAGLLHDVVEDCDIALASLEPEFGSQVVQLVDGLTKLELTEFGGEGEEPEARQQSQAERRRAENLRKIFLAMARDARVMVIKLADRLHNMRTLGSLSAERQLRIARETLDIYTPLAHRLGIWKIKWELEDLAFKYLMPEEYAEISEKVARTRAERESDIQEAIVILNEALLKEGVQAEIQGRPKHLFSIYNKIRKEQVTFSEIYDLIALRIICHTVPDCYHALGVVHDLWKPIPERFDDYIAKPKSNMYQSLHTKVVGPRNEPLEIQIRTWAMHRTADFGIAAHWQYKEGGAIDSGFAQKLSWLRKQLADMNRITGDAAEFLSNVTSELFYDQVFVFTPKGDVIDLPKGSTPIDFAYRIHTDVGHQCVGAKVNGRIVPLNYTFKNGDIASVITRSGTTPSLDWLNLAKTGHARSKIKAYFKKLRYAENVARGRELLEREIERQHLENLELLRNEWLQQTAEMLNYPAIEDMLAAIGHGTTAPQNVVTKLLIYLKQEGLLPPQEPSPVAGRPMEVRETSLKMVIGGVDDLMIRRARCCCPVPGDEVVGFISRGKGMSIHREDCPNGMAYREKDPDRLVPIDWKEEANGQRYDTPIHIEVLDRVGLLNDITGIFSETKTNIESANIRSRPDKTAMMEFMVDVSNLEHLNTVMNSVRRLSDVIDVYRLYTVRNGKGK
ncbi:MAG: bifunctional (p)ppGpp synthetase/guanosine-3',5'-bis(diphosphate) 3'-pyrophosphohydrolase [Armatimonadetes bacterium]|nr:bifunctional (p)ppGpp synthetase/guanosine-3',5'-bis(diphosphate) 3'-pyrophosphohydrolase [Armatimonadota bacterium]